MISVPPGCSCRTPSPPRAMVRGFFFRLMNHVAFLVDGFNVYHSLRAAQAVLGCNVKWLDLHGLCASYVHSSLFGSEAVLGSVIYFSAFATFFGPTNPRVLVRHRAYVRALEATVDAAYGSGRQITPCAALRPFG